MFTLFCAQNWFVFDANFNSPNNKDGLFLEYQIILASCLHVQINSIKSNKEINCSEIQNSQRYMYSANSFLQKPFLTSNYPDKHQGFTGEYWPKIAAVKKWHSANIPQYSSRKQGNFHALTSLGLN